MAEEVVAVVAVAQPEAAAQVPLRPRAQALLKRGMKMVPAALPTELVRQSAAVSRRAVVARQVVRRRHRWPPGLLAVETGYCMRPRTTRSRSRRTRRSRRASGLGLS